MVITMSLLTSDVLTKNMKIKDLIDELKRYDENTEVHISKDPEGNEIRTTDFVSCSDYSGDEEHPQFLVVIYPTDEIVA